MLQYDGILLCDKPFGITSHDVINDLRKIIGQKKIGHTGTLDPRATGLIVTCLGRATKIAQFFSNMDKTYEAEIRLGARSRTMDAEGIDPDTPLSPIPNLSENDIKDLLKTFKGKITQRVPAFSAVKINGQRLYKLARKNIKVEPPEREVEIKEIALSEMRMPSIFITVSCSKGVYIRTLADDIGQKIGCGAYLNKLSRIEVGQFKLGDALNLNEIRHLRQAGSLKKHILQIESVLPFPSIQVDEKFSPCIISGRQPKVKDLIGISDEFKTEDFITLRDHCGQIMAVGKAGVDSHEIDDNFKGDNFFKYVRVLN